MNKYASIIRVVSRYRVAVADFVIKGEWSNFSSYSDQLKKIVKGLHELEDLFDSSSAKKKIEEIDQARKRYDHMIAEYSPWFKDYPGSPPPAKLDADLMFWVDADDVPNFDSFAESLGERSTAATMLNRSYKKERAQIDKIIQILYDYTEDPSPANEEKARKAQAEVRQIDLSDDEQVWRQFGELLPEAQQEFEKTKKWVTDLGKAGPKSEIVWLIKNWEDMIVNIGDDGGENLFSSVMETDSVQDLETLSNEVFRELSRAAGSLASNLFP